MTRLTFPFFFAASLVATPGTYAFDHAHSAWTQVLNKYQVTDGKLRYKQLKIEAAADPKHALLNYLKDIQAVKKTEYDGWDRTKQMAFLINAYNALTVKLIIDNYPVKSIKDIGGLFRSPWKKEFFTLLDGAIKALDPIEHDNLRPTFKDARVHAAVNCASLSCPRLHRVAFVGDKLDSQLDAAFSEFVNDPTRNRFEPESGVLYLSKIFDWFEKDFKTSYDGVLKTIEKFGPPGAKQAIQKGGDIKYLTYEWELNEAADSGASVTDKRAQNQ